MLGLELGLGFTDRKLSAYPDSYNRLLDHIFDEHGLIVYGWSGEWDHALRAAYLKLVAWSALDVCREFSISFERCLKIQPEYPSHPSQQCSTHGHEF